MTPSTTLSGWTPDGWRTRPATQLPDYPDPSALAAVEARLALAPPVVAIDDARRLRDAMARLHAQGGFLLQGGDCAENFDDAVAEGVARLVGLFDGMGEAITSALGNAPLVEVARIAGQFAKPRTSPDEQRGVVTLPAYRGDIVNGLGFDRATRAHDPARMVRAHMQSVGTAASLAAARPADRPVFTSHEGLLLPYEQALTRRDQDGRWWACSGHMLWLGHRTRDLGGAHVAYLSGIANVVGVKVGDDLDADSLLRLADRLDPANQPGKLVLIGRFGATRIADALPPLLRATRAAGLAAVWAIDPMHGNSRLEGARKIRRWPDILAEARAFFAICRAEGVHAGGIHLEMSGDDVTECLGGAGPESIADLDRNWRSACDPRLNRGQALELADEIAALLAAERAGAVAA